MGQIDPTRIPLFAGIPRVALARLAPDLEIVSCDQDQLFPFPEPDRVYLVTEGQIECTSVEADQVMPLYTVASGDMILRPTEEQVVKLTRFHCLTPVELVKIPHERLEELAKHYPAVANALQGQLANRLNHTQLELVRTRRLLATYVRELWGSVPEDEAAAEITLSQERAETPTKAQRESAKPSPKPQTLRSAWFSLLINVAIILGVWIIIPRGANPSYYLLGILVWAGANWALGNLPDHVVALAAAFTCVILGIVSLEVAFGGFASGSWWMMLAVLGVVVAITRTGLVYRLALAMLKVLPPTYWWQSLALTLTGIAVTPLLPSLNSRMSVVGPLASELSDAMQLPPRSKGSAGLAMAAYLGTAQSYFLFLNGAQTSLLLWSILSPEIKAQVTWGFWVLAALPMALVLLIGFMAILFLYYRPDSAKPVSRSTVLLQQAVLGPITRQEWVLVGLVGALLLGFITEPWHGISSTWPAVGIFLILMTSDLLNKEGLKQIDWSLTMYLGAVSSLSAIAQKVGLNQTLTDMIAPWVTRLNLNATAFLVGVALLTILFRLVAPPAVATVVLTVALEPVARVLSINPFAPGLVVVAFCTSWLVPQQWSVYLSLVNATNERCFTHDQVRGLAWANNLLLLLGLLASIPLWRYMGLMP
jgi:DASS family divalent anion:Na+ symporter